MEFGNIKKYFNKETENWIHEHNKCTDKRLKDQIYTKHIHPALLLLTECVISKYYVGVKGADKKDVEAEVIAELYQKLPLVSNEAYMTKGAKDGEGAFNLLTLFGRYKAQSRRAAAASYKGRFTKYDDLYPQLTTDAGDKNNKPFKFDAPEVVDEEHDYSKGLVAAFIEHLEGRMSEYDANCSIVARLYLEQLYDAANYNMAIKELSGVIIEKSGLTRFHRDQTKKMILAELREIKTQYDNDQL